MGRNEEYMIKVFLTPEGSKAFGSGWGYLVLRLEQTTPEITQNFVRASRFRDRQAAEQCVETLRAGYAPFDEHVSKVEYMAVRE